MNPIIIIPARMKARRLPDKPLADIHGKPMILHVVERARASGIGIVYVACDDTRIKSAVVEAGGFAVMTRDDHVSGSDRIYEALQHIDPDEEHDIIVNVQGDVPTLSPEVIRAVLLPLKDKTVSIATLACRIKDESERNDPCVVKPVLSFVTGGTLPPVALHETSPAGSSHSAPPRTHATDEPQLATALYFSRATIPYGEGDLYHHIGIYAYRREALAKFVSLPPSPLEQRERLEQLRAIEAGMKIGVAIVDTVPLGVDAPEHLEKARKMLEGK
jgi:3-deoxy-manno-octulosonate cytidylyltransferase (CMP-KDO synthetase)